MFLQNSACVFHVLCVQSCLNVLFSLLCVCVCVFLALRLPVPASLFLCHCVSSLIAGLSGRIDFEQQDNQVIKLFH